MNQTLTGVVIMCLMYSVLIFIGNKFLDIDLFCGCHGNLFVIKPIHEILLNVIIGIIAFMQITQRNRKIVLKQ
jgi:hypothetical protein